MNPNVCDVKSLSRYMGRGNDLTSLSSEMLFKILQNHLRQTGHASD